jgi:transposase-like protein
VRQWALKFGQTFANEIRRRLPCVGDKWHLDEVVIKIAGKTHWLWRAVDQHGVVLDVLVQSRRDAKAAKRLLRKLLKRQGQAPRVMITDKLASYPAAKKDQLSGGEEGSDTWCRASPAQGIEQPGGEFASTDTTTRATDETVQIAPTGAAALTR